MTFESILIVSVSLAVSSFTFSFAGFGYGLLAVPLLSLVMPVKDAVAVQLPASFMLVTINMFRYGKQVKWDDLKPLFIGSSLAIPVGALSLSFLPDMMMKRALAVFVIGVILFDRSGFGKAQFNTFARSAVGGGILGMISGWFIGAYTTGGPPAVIYATARFPEPEKAKGAMAIYFCITDILIVLLFAMTGVMTPDLFYQSILFFPAVLFGFLTGSYFFGDICRKTYMIGVHALLGVAAVMLSI